MFNSFLDGTKSAIEMAAVANASGLTTAPGELSFPPCGADNLARVLKPAVEGGVLHHRGQVEVVSSLERDGRPVARDLRWGVYVTFAADDEYVRRCFGEYGLATDDSGNYAALYKPYHLIGLAHGARLARAVGKGAIVTWADVVVEDSEIMRFRREMEALFAAEPGTPSPGRGLPG